jgi:hypothetical protein
MAVLGAVLVNVSWSPHSSSLPAMQFLFSLRRLSIQSRLHFGRTIFSLFAFAVDAALGNVARHHQRRRRQDARRWARPSSGRGAHWAVVRRRAEKRGLRRVQAAQGGAMEAYCSNLKKSFRVVPARGRGQLLLIPFSFFSAQLIWEFAN